MGVSTSRKGTSSTPAAKRPAMVIVITNQDSTSSRLLPGSSYSCCIRNLHALVHKQCHPVHITTMHPRQQLSADMTIVVAVALEERRKHGLGFNLTIWMRLSQNTNDSFLYLCPKVPNRSNQSPPHPAVQQLETVGHWSEANCMPVCAGLVGAVRRYTMRTQQQGLLMLGCGAVGAGCCSSVQAGHWLLALKAVVQASHKTTQRLHSSTTWAEATPINSSWCQDCPQRLICQSRQTPQLNLSWDTAPKHG
jgi:hypothetical protein